MRTVGLMLAGVFLTLAIVGGFLALDRTALHWYAESDETAPTPVPTRLAGPAFRASDVLNLTTSQVAEAGNFPSGTSWVRCVGADFRQGNRFWVVACEFRVNRDDANPEATKSFSFDDRTGKIVR